MTNWDHSSGDHFFRDSFLGIRNKYVQIINGKLQITNCEWQIETIFPGTIFPGIFFQGFFSRDSK